MKPCDPRTAPQPQPLTVAVHSARQLGNINMPGNGYHPSTVEPCHRARPRRWDTAVVAATVVLTLTGCTSTAANNRGSAGTPDNTAGTPAAAQLLQQLAASIIAVPADDKDSRRYPYSAIRVQSWKPGPTVLTGTDTTVWRTADGTGRRDTRRLSARSEHTGMPSPSQRRRLDTATVTTEDYRRPGQLPGTVSEPVPRDPATLATALTVHQLGETGPRVVIQAYSDLNSYHYLDRPTRAAALHMLATIDQLRYDGIAKDLHGRTGIAFAVDSAHHRDTILIDASTGRLLTRSQTRSTPPAALTEHSIYLSNDRTATAGVVPAMTAVVANADAATHRQDRHLGRGPDARRDTATAAPANTRPASWSPQMHGWATLLVWPAATPARASAQQHPKPTSLAHTREKREQGQSH